MGGISPEGEWLGELTILVAPMMPVRRFLLQPERCAQGPDVLISCRAKDGLEPMFRRNFAQTLVVIRDITAQNLR
jgi:hypothetical protein